MNIRSAVAISVSPVQGAHGAHPPQRQRLPALDCQAAGRTDWIGHPCGAAMDDPAVNQHGQLPRHVSCTAVQVQHTCSNFLVAMTRRHCDSSYVAAAVQLRNVCCSIAASVIVSDTWNCSHSAEGTRVIHHAGIALHHTAQRQVRSAARIADLAVLGNGARGAL